MSLGTLYGIGVGPGDPELLTLKAARLIDRTSMLAVPVSRPGGDSYALSIVSSRLTTRHRVLELHFPMVKDAKERARKRKEAAEQVFDGLRRGDDVAFLTEGDPCLHSTFGHLKEHLPLDVPIEIVPGVSSVTAAAAEGQRVLVQGEESLAIVPAAYLEPDELRALFADFDTVVLLKVHQVLDKLIRVLEELSLIGASLLVERATHAQGRIVQDISSLREEPPHYLSLMVVHSGRLREDH